MEVVPLLWDEQRTLHSGELAVEWVHQSGHLFKVVSVDLPTWWPFRFDLALASQVICYVHSHKTMRMVLT